MITKSRLIFSLFLLLLLGGPGATAQDAKEKQRISIPVTTARAVQQALEPRPAIDLFFAQLAEGRVEEAYDNLVRGSIIEERKEDVDALKERSMRAIDAYGRVRSYEVLNEASAGTSLRRFTCLSLNEELPLRWRFYFYNSAKGWKLVDLRVDDGLVELFEEASARERKTP